MVVEAAREPDLDRARCCGMIALWTEVAFFADSDDESDEPDDDEVVDEPDDELSSDELSLVDDVLSEVYSLWVFFVLVMVFWFRSRFLRACLFFLHLL